MLRYIAGRFAQALVGILTVSTIIFFLVRLTGDPTSLLVPDYAPASAQVALRSKLGLDQSWYDQYGRFLGHLLTGDLGTSFSGQSVSSQIMPHLVATGLLALVALTMAVVVGVPLGILGATYRGTPIDAITRFIATLGQSIPVFWLAILMIILFSVELRWLPVAGQASLSSYILPAIALGWPAMAGIVRLMRSSMLEVMDADYIRMARAKGLAPFAVVFRHGLRNALIPVVTFTGLLLGTFMNGSVVVESIFAWPGIGQMAFQSVTLRDFPTVQGAVIVFAAVFIIINFIVDVLYLVIDPRIRYR